jgi:hypothetical protein
MTGEEDITINSSRDGVVRRVLLLRNRYRKESVSKVHCGMVY